MKNSINQNPYRNVGGYIVSVSDLHHHVRHSHQSILDFIKDDGLSGLSAINQLRIRTIAKKLRYANKVTDRLMAPVLEASDTAKKRRHQ